MSFEENDLKGIAAALGRKISENQGIKICLEQGSVNFENWVQIELCSILFDRDADKQYKISVEKENNTDIVVKLKGKETIVAAFEIKIICLGGVIPTRLIDDVRKLIKNDKFDDEVMKLLFYVIYENHSIKNIECGWGNFFGKGKPDYREMIIKFLDENGIKPSNSIEDILLGGETPKVRIEYFAFK